MLVSACLLNFGDVEVSFQNGDVSAELHGQEAMVIEFSIIRKETDDWDSVKSPLLYLGQNFADIKNAKILSSWTVRFSPMQRNRLTIRRLIMSMASSGFWFRKLMVSLPKVVGLEFT